MAEMSSAPFVFPAERLAPWLACPHCGQSLEAADALALRCPSRHSFDVNKRGYVTLVPADDRMSGDSIAMLDARDAFLDGGHYSPILAALQAALPSALGRLLDAGCGSGYYLDGVLSSRPDTSALALDISADAVRRTVRRTGAVGVVADTWRPLPLRTASVDAIIDVFAPRNVAEFARVLRPDGVFVVVIPGEDHLRELRGDGGAISVHPEKLRRLLEDAEALFSHEGTASVTSTMQLNAHEVAALLGMGPSAHHTSAHTTAAQDTTCDVQVVSLRRRA